MRNKLAKALRRIANYQKPKDKTYRVDETSGLKIVRADSSYSIYKQLKNDIITKKI